MRLNLLARLTIPLLFSIGLLLTGCAGKSPFTGSMTKIDAAAVNNGEKSLVVLRVSSPAGGPVETRWLHQESGELYKISSQFSASTQEVAREYDMVTLPPGRYVLMYAMYAGGTSSAWPTQPFDIDPARAKVSDLGQVRTSEQGSPATTIYQLRSPGLARDGRTALIASFTLTPGKVVYLGDMTMDFGPQGPVQLPGYYPAGSVSYGIHYNLEQARIALGQEDASLASKLTRMNISRGVLARAR